MGTSASLHGVFRVARDAEVRDAGQYRVATLALVFEHGTRKDPATGYYPSQFVDAGLWGDQADRMAPHLTKGTIVSAILEAPHIEEYQKRDGSTGVKLAARVLKIDFVPRQAEDAGGGGQRQEQAAPPARSAPPSRSAPPPRTVPPTPPPRQAAAPAARQGSGFDDMDDDIPF